MPRYPLAHHRPFAADRQLLLDAQDASDLPGDYSLVAVVRGQLVLTPASQSFVERVTWENDVAAGWRPHDDRRSPVRIAPDVRFGKPSVGGVSTEVLWERTEGGEDQEELAEAFALSPAGVRWALAYEHSRRAA